MNDNTASTDCKTVKGQTLCKAMSDAEFKFNKTLMNTDSDTASMLDDIANSMTDSELVMFTYGFRNSYYWHAWNTLFHDYNIRMTVELFRYLYDTLIANSVLFNQAVYHTDNASMYPDRSLIEMISVERLLMNKAYDYTSMSERLSGINVALSK